MTKTIKFSLLLVLVSVTAFINPLKAQDHTKELAMLAKKFQDAYNKQDVKSLKTMYTDDAVSTGTDGVTTTGNENIGEGIAKNFATGKVMITIKQEKVVTTDGTTTASGTYHVTGKTNAGEAIEINGSFINTVVKVKGQWKISKSVLANL
jgi:uncharacterized protein (TIGR02246 family)